jgi:hypothetical protein
MATLKWILYRLLILFFLYVAVTSIIYRFTHVDMTEARLMLNLHKAIMLDFK